MLKKQLRKLCKRALRPFIPLLKELIEEDDKSKKALLLGGLKHQSKGISVGYGLRITNARLLYLGDYTKIGDNVHFNSKAGISIGRNAVIGDEVKVQSVHGFQNISPESLIFIGNNVRIGRNSIILPGVYIGSNNVIPPGSVVKEDLPVRSTSNAQGISSSVVSTQGKGLIFIMGTGRSGSTTIAEVLSQHPHITCEHEPLVALIQWSTDYAHGLLSYAELKAKLIELFSSVSVSPGEHYGISDQKLSNLIPLLYELFPEARFVWLYRNAQSVVSSTYSRGWFSDRECGVQKETADDHILAPLNIYGVNRINAALVSDEVKETQWAGMSAFERNCWYWAYWNGMIADALAALPSERVFELKLETLASEVPALNDFLEVKEYDYNIMVANKAHYDLHKEWTEEEQVAFERHCAPLMQKLYPRLENTTVSG